MMVAIYHNPRCSKSRQALELLRKRGVEPEIIEYLKTPPTKAELKRILKQLGLEPRALMRKGEAVYKAGQDDGSTGPGAGAGAGGSAGGDSTVVDADFEEVDDDKKGRSA